MILFDLPNTENGYLSIDAPMAFTLNDIRYATARQYLIHQKAVLFSEDELAKEALKTSAPAALIAIGDKIAPPDNVAWLRLCKPILETGLSDMYFQNPDNMKRLLATKNEVLAYASEDLFWGTGILKNADGADSFRSWTGENNLGRALMEVRAELSVSMMDFYYGKAPAIIPEANEALLLGLMQTWCAEPNAHGTVLAMGSSLIYEIERGEDLKPYTITIPTSRYFSTFEEFKTVVERLEEKKKIFRNVTNKMHWILTLMPEE